MAPVPLSAEGHHQKVRAVGSEEMHRHVGSANEHVPVDEKQIRTAGLKHYLQSCAIGSFTYDVHVELMREQQA